MAHIQGVWKCGIVALFLPKQWNLSFKRWFDFVGETFRDELMWEKAGGEFADPSFSPPLRKLFIPPSHRPTMDRRLHRFQFEPHLHLVTPSDAGSGTSSIPGPIAIHCTIWLPIHTSESGQIKNIKESGIWHSQHPLIMPPVLLTLTLLRYVVVPEKRPVCQKGNQWINFFSTTMIHFL